MTVAGCAGGAESGRERLFTWPRRVLCSTYAHTSIKEKKKGKFPIAIGASSGAYDGIGAKDAADATERRKKKDVDKNDRLEDGNTKSKAGSSRNCEEKMQIN